MRIVKWLVGLLAALGIIVLGGGLLLSSKFTVSRSVTVAAPLEKVYALVASPRQWKGWTVWNRRDPAMQIEYFGPETGPGAGWAWKSKSEGDGRMTFTGAQPGRRVAFDLYFPDFDSTSHGELTFAAAGPDTQVTWMMNGDFGSNPVMRWFALFADRMVGPDFEGGLANLKALAEKN